MIHWTPYIFVRFVFFIILGILLQSYFPVLSFIQGLYLLFSSFAVYLLLYIVFSKHFNPNINAFQGFLALLMLTVFAYLRSYQYQATNDHLHLIHLSDTIKAYTATVDAQVLKKGKYERTELLVEKVKVGKQWLRRKGRVLAYFKINKPKRNNLKYGQKLLIYSSPYLINSTNNPEAFNYATYLSLEKNIYYQHFIEPYAWKRVGYKPQSILLAWAYQVRENCDRILRKYINSRQEYSIATALVLGVKDSLDNNIRQAYSSAGLMHILAVSGLHVGIITYILIFLFGKVKTLPYGKHVFLILTGLSLSFYCLLTGFSASVVRASLMFFLLVLGQNLQRTRSPYNTLAFVAFCLLLYKPTWLFAVGFQLSFLAVVGIFYIQPKVYNWFTFRHRVLDKAWQIISVSIAAQLATAPLAIYYFHQFPNYFLLSNLLILPIIASIIYACLSVLVLSWVPILNTLTGLLAKWAIYLMNQVIFTLEKLPFAVADALYFELWQVYVVYALIVFVLIFLALKKFRYLLYATLLLAVVSISRILRNYEQNFQEKLVVYNLPKQSNISFIRGKRAVLLGHTSIDKSTFEFGIRNHFYSLCIEERSFIKFKNFRNKPKQGFVYEDFDKYALLLWQKKTFLIIKSYLRYRELLALRNIKTDYTIIQNNAVWDLEKFVAVVPSQSIVLDSSNGFFRSQKLSKQAKEMNIPFHAVGQKGAFVLE